MLEKNKRTLWSLFAALASGVMLAMCFPGWNFSGLVWVWMLPLFPAIWRGGRKRHGFGIGYLAGLVFWLLNLKWLWMVSGLGAMAMAAFLAIYFGLWGMVAVSLGNPWRKRKNGGGKNNMPVNKIQRKIAGKEVAEKKRGGRGNGVLTESMRSLKFAFVNAAAWVGFEWLRGWVFTGFSWNGLGVAFHETPVLAQAADLVGVTGLAFTPVFFAAVVVQMARRLGTEARIGRLRPRFDFGVAVILLAVQFSYGVWRVNDVSGWETQRVRVLLVQENISQDIKWEETAVMEIIEGYRASTTQAMEDMEIRNFEKLKNSPSEICELQHPDLIIWPESAMPNPLLYIGGESRYLFYGDVRHLIENEIRPLGRFTLISGMNEFEAERRRGIPRWKEGGRQYNSIAVIPPDAPIGESVRTYRKTHLVIFGEYIPFVREFPFLGEFFKFSSGTDFAGNFDVGISTNPLSVPTGEGEVQLIPGICFEDTVGRLTRKFVRRAPQVILNVTNDGWFKQSEAAAQHMANARFRAIELRRPMIRSANTGVSAIVSVTGSLYDPVTGRKQVVEDSGGNHFTRGFIYGHAYAPRHGSLTLYALAGDWFPWLMMACVTLVFVKKRFLKS